jgi:hypothetical protein
MVEEDLVAFEKSTLGYEASAGESLREPQPRYGGGWKNGRGYKHPTQVRKGVRPFRKGRIRG